MIEPVEFVARDEIYRLNQNGIPLFALCREPSSNWLSCVGLFPQDGSDNTIFVVWRHTNSIGLSRTLNGFYISHNKSREMFMDHLFEYYPHHAEWFLFHPEWT